MIEVLQKRLTDLKESSGKLPESLLSADKAVAWDKPKDDPRLTDPDKVAKSFDREEAAQAYKKALDDADADLTTRDAVSAKLQSDLLSSMQQGFVIRHRSRLAMLADAASFRKSVQEVRIELMMERHIANVEATQ